MHAKLLPANVTTKTIHTHTHILPSLFPTLMSLPVTLPTKLPSAHITHHFLCHSCISLTHTHTRDLHYYASTNQKIDESNQNHDFYHYFHEATDREDIELNNDYD